ncbi:MAG: hypothetical protein MZV64_20665 [Ignavibacteriales bacterium]|nr:hypothetical protein [Ignavibacteriales bacterium]
MKAVKGPGAVVKVLHTKMKGIRQTGQFDIEVEIMAPRSESMQNIFGQASLRAQPTEGPQLPLRPRYFSQADQTRISDKSRQAKSLRSGIEL